MRFEKRPFAAVLEFPRKQFELDRGTSGCPQSAPDRSYRTGHGMNRVTAEVVRIPVSGRAQLHRSVQDGDISQHRVSIIFP